MNNVSIIGNLTRDPELRYTPSGKAVTDINVAVNSGYGDKKETVFLDVTVWDKTAENVCEYLAKGRQVAVTGRLVQDNWEDRETGQKRSKIKLVASTVEFIGKGDSGNSGGGSRASGVESAPPAANGETFDDVDDDCPF